jgi:hypothetical protein
MAEHDHGDHEYHRGEMDIREQAHTYEMFGELSKWGSLLTAVAVLVLTLWFCTNVGFFGGAIPGVVLLVAGIFFLRKGPSESH